MSTYPVPTPGAPSGGPPGGNGRGGPDTPEVLTLAIINQVNFFVFGFIGLFILLRIPHLIAFMKSNSGRPILQILGKATSVPRPSSKSKKANLGKGPDDLEMFDNHRRAPIQRITFHDLEPTNAQKPTTLSPGVPPRVMSVPNFLEPLITLLRSRELVPGYSGFQLAVMMNYTYILLYGAFRLSNPFTDNTRSAWLAVSQLPLIFGLAQKSNILGSLLGYGYESLNYMHRYAGLLSILAGNVHAIYYIFRWTNSGTFLKSVSVPGNAWGLVLLIAMDILFFFSLEFWRRKAYNVFFWSHTIGVIVLFPAACLHRPGLQPYIFACVALYAVDRIIRAAKSKIRVASITALPQMDMAYLEIPELKSGWRAGQHVRLRVLSTGLGPLGWAESHPFTIASASGSEDGLVLLCKKAGDWTGKLVEFAKAKDANGMLQGQGNVKVWIEGPFGGPSRMVFASFSSAVLVVGGSGITFGLSMMEELLVKDRSNETRLKYIELVWIVQNPASITPLIPLFTTLVRQTEFITLRISIYYTRALTEKVTLFGQVEASPYTSVTITHPNLTLTPGRPNLKNVLNNAVDNALSVKSGKGLPSASGVAVGICGPVSLGEQVIKSVQQIDAATRFRVGGIEVHEETFGW